MCIHKNVHVLPSSTRLGCPSLVDLLPFCVPIQYVLPCKGRAAGLFSNNNIWRSPIPQPLVPVSVSSALAQSSAICILIISRPVIYPFVRPFKNTPFLPPIRIARVISYNNIAVKRRLFHIPLPTLTIMEPTNFANRPESS